MSLKLVLLRHGHSRTGRLGRTGRSDGWSGRVVRTGGQEGQSGVNLDPEYLIIYIILRLSLRRAPGPDLILILLYSGGRRPYPRMDWLLPRYTHPGTHPSIPPRVHPLLHRAVLHRRLHGCTGRWDGLFFVVGLYSVAQVCYSALFREYPSMTEVCNVASLRVNPWQSEYKATTRRRYPISGH